MRRVKGDREKTLRKGERIKKDKIGEEMIKKGM